MSIIVVDIIAIPFAIVGKLVVITAAAATIATANFYHNSLSFLFDPIEFKR